MSKVTFDLTDDAFVGLDRIAQALGDTTPLMQTIGRILTTKIQLGFRASTSPWGVPWAPLKVRKGQPLIDTRRLLSSITYNAGDGYVDIGTNVSYAPYHQFGFTVHVAEHTKDLYFMQDRSGNVGNRFVRKDRSNFVQKAIVKAHDIVVPARPFLPITQDEVNLPQSWANDSLQAIRSFYESKL